MLKILQAMLQQYIDHELPDVHADFTKGRGTRNQTANICWIIDKAREFQKKTSNSALLTMPKPLTVWITTNCGKFWKRWEYQTTWPASSEICIQPFLVFNGVILNISIPLKGTKWHFTGSPVAKTPGRAPGLISSWGTKSYMLKLRICMPQLKVHML